MTMPVAVLLDLDNTLYHYRPCHEAGLLAFGRAWKRLGMGTVEDGMEQYRLGRAEVQSRIKGVAAEHNRVLYVQSAVERLSGMCDSRTTLECEGAYWDGFLDAMKMFEGAGGWLRSLKKAGVPVAIVSDMVADVTHRKMLKLGLDKLVARLVSSEEAGVEKPSPKPFLLALQKLGKAPSKNVFMVGDSLERDVRPALKLGMSAVLVNAWERASGKNDARPGAGYKVVGDYRDFSRIVGWP